MLSTACVAIEFVLGLALALAMVREFRGRGLVMSILIVPLFISPVIVGQLWALLLQRPFGPTNYILSQILGHEVTISWLTQSPWNFFAIILADVWQWTPFMFVILLAGLTSIPPNLYEAAELDGVGPWLAFRAITLPHLVPMMLLAVTFRLLDAIRLFDTIFMMTGGGPGTQTYTASFYLYTVGFTQFHLSPGDGRKLDLPGLHPARRVAPRPAAAPHGAGLMAVARRPPQAPLLPGRAHPAARLLPRLRAAAALLDVQHLDQAERRLPGDPAGLVPARSRRSSTTRAALFTYRGLDGLINSLIVSVSATALSALLGTLMAYSLARYNTGGKHLSFWVLSQRFLPPIGIILPVFLIYRTLGIHDTRFGLVIAYTVFTLPVSVWMMFAYFRQMPTSMEEAAQVDGWTRWQAFWRVAVPLAAPGIAAAAVFAFIACWTEFFFALVLTSRNAFTLPTVFRAFIGFQGAQYGEAAALAMVSLVPSIVLGVLVQRHLVRGLTLGAVRG